MRLLGIDCSSENISLAAVEDEKILLNMNKKKKKAASQVIVWIKKFLDEKRLKLNDFDAFVVGAGPGSFTGLRVSFSIIKAFSVALKKPVISLGSFYSLAYKVKNHASQIAAFSDAGRDLIYGAVFKVKKEQIRKIKKESFFKLEEFINTFKDSLFVTYQEHLKEKVLSIFPEVLIYPQNVWPSALFLCKVAEEFFKRKKFTSLKNLEPIYVYPQECQIKDLSIAKGKKIG